VPFAGQVDICIASACGHPRDINAYQAQKALDHADRITRPGGTIILAAECPQGYGEEVFQEWMLRRWPPARVMEEIRRRFVIGGHKAYGFAKVAAEKSWVLLSALSTADTEALYAVKPASLQEAVDAAAGTYGPAATWAYMPAGGITLPVPVIDISTCCK
jgi:nickel-dependent lactate racemase